MADAIIFAGLTLNWEETYARQYAEKLLEMGYCSKVIQDHFWIVAYSHRSFSRQEAIDVYEKLIKRKIKLPSE